LNRIIPPPPGKNAAWNAREKAGGRTGAQAAFAAWEDWMRMAIAEARKALRLGEVPVGALVVDGAGRILGRGFNQPALSHTPHAHAEIMALAEAGRQLKNYRLNNCFLITTLEPCLMCSGAAVHARVEGVVYGARDPGAGCAESCLEALDLSFHNHHPWHMGGILEQECSELLNGFFAGRRANL
jgi:tRNA(adenine34) deaminase